MYSKKMKNQKESCKKWNKMEISNSDAVDCGLFDFFFFRYLLGGMHDSVTFIRNSRFRTTPRGQLLRRHYVTFMRSSRNILVFLSIHNNFYCLAVVVAGTVRCMLCENMRYGMTILLYVYIYFVSYSFYCARNGNGKTCRYL